MTHYIDSAMHDAPLELSRHLRKCIQKHQASWSDLVFLCIGTDRMTGDCLGPCVGQLLKSHQSSAFSVYGTLESPVHALNLPDICSSITSLHPHPLIIAVDACLGQKKHLGFMTVKNGALFPGAGVSKKIPPVGDISITGIVNIAGTLEHLTLQTTRLSFVIALADQIAQGILEGISPDISYKNSFTDL